MVKEFAIKYKYYIIGFILFLMVLGLVWYYASKYGKNSVAPPIPGDNPNDPLTTEERTQIASLAERLQSDINGIVNPLFRDWAVYNELATSSNRVFVGTYNQYKVLTNRSLKADMQGESYWLDQMPGAQSDIIQLIMDRFAGQKLP